LAEHGKCRNDFCNHLLYLGLKRKRFFSFSRKAKSCENEVIFAKFCEISFRENFRFRECVHEHFCINFSFCKNCRENFCQKKGEKVWSKYDYTKKKKFCVSVRRHFRFRENFRENTQTKIFVSTILVSVMYNLYVIPTAYS
jgi:hypothetical protein